MIDRLRAAYGHRRWWPAASAFELILGAVLTQNVAWRNVERAIDSLRQIAPLTPAGLRRLDPQTLGESIRPSGYWRVKERRLRAVLDHLASRADLEADQGEAALADLLSLPTERLRATLLAIHGIGRETADCVLVYAAGYPIFVVDTYTRRLAHRLGWFPDERTDYETLRRFVEADLSASTGARPAETATQTAAETADAWGDAHAQIVHHGNAVCTKRRPRCGVCPLQAICPQIGVEPRVEPEDRSSDDPTKAAAGAYAFSTRTRFVPGGPLIEPRR